MVMGTSARKQRGVAPQEHRYYRPHCKCDVIKSVQNRNFVFMHSSHLKLIFLLRGEILPKSCAQS